MSNVELIYDLDCPNIRAARTQLLRAFAATGLIPRWREWAIGQADLPEHARQYGSPTILVQGKDVAGGEAPGTDACCRIYADSGGAMRGVPAVEQIAAMLRARSGASGRWRLNIAVVSSVGVALLPKLTCPACWPAYAGLLSAMGLGVLATGTWLLPLTLGFLGIALGALAYRARQRRGFGPLLVGLVAGTLMVLGKFLFDNDPALYAGVGLLMAASLWNTWPRKTDTTHACAACDTLENQ